MPDFTGTTEYASVAHGYGQHRLRFAKRPSAAIMTPQTEKEPGRRPLGLKHAVHVRAAEYWLALGKFDEANEELQRIQISRRKHPAVMSLQARIQEAQTRRNSEGDSRSEEGAPRPS